VAARPATGAANRVAGAILPGFASPAVAGASFVGIAAALVPLLLLLDFFFMARSPFVVLARSSFARPTRPAATAQRSL
jgi:hypothetical protein